MLAAQDLGSYFSPGNIFHSEDTSHLSSSQSHDNFTSSYRPPPTSLLASIRSIFPSYDSSLSTRVPTYQYSRQPLQDPYGDRSGPFSTGRTPKPIEELLWYRDKVIWSKGSTVFRTFTYSHEEEQVRQAIFAWFPSIDEAEEAGDVDETEQDKKGKGLHPTAPRHGAVGSQPFPNTFGPFTVSYGAKWTDPRKKSLHASHNWNPWSKSGSKKEPGSSVERCLVVFLESVAHIYFASGEDRIVPLPFLVEKVVSLRTGGIILQRQLSNKEQNAIDNDGGRERRTRTRSGKRSSSFEAEHGVGIDGDEFPPVEPKVNGIGKKWRARFYAMSHPNREMSVVASQSGMTINCGDQGRGDITLEDIPTTTEIAMMESEPYPFAVLYDKRRQEIGFYKWTRRKQAPSQQGEMEEPDFSHRKRRRSSIAHSGRSRGNGDHAHLEDPSTIRARNLSIDLDLGPPTSHQRIRRGVSGRKSTGGSSSRKSISVIDKLEQDVADADGLRTGLDANADLLNRPQTSRRASSGAGARSLGIGSGTGSGYRVGLGSGTEAQFDRRGIFLDEASEMDLRETTMLMGIEETGGKEKDSAEIILREIRRWSIPVDETGKIQSVKAFLSDTIRPDFTHINVHITAEAPTLFVFRATTDPLGQTVVDDFQTLAASSAFPVLSTRSRIPDTLVCNPVSPNPALILSAGFEFPVMLPHLSSAAHQNTEAIKVVDVVDSQAIIEGVDGSLQAVNLYFAPQSRLVRQVLLALSTLLTATTFHALKRRFLEELQISDARSEMTKFRSSLLVFCGFVRTSPNMTPFERMISRSRLPSDLIKATDSHQRSAPKPRETLPWRPTGGPDSRYQVLCALHSVAEDLRLDTVRFKDRDDLVRIIAVISRSLHLKFWIDYYCRLDPTVVAFELSIWNIETNPIPLSQNMLEPIDYTSILFDVICGRSASIRKALLKGEKNAVPCDSNEPLPQFTALLAIYGCLRPRKGTISKERAHQSLMTLIDAGLNRSWILRLPYHISIPILEAIKICRYHADKGWCRRLYNLIDRVDIAAQMQLGHRNIPVDFTMGANSPQTTQSKAGDISSFKDTVSPSFRLRGVGANLPNLRFSGDRRLQDVERMLLTDRVRTLRAPESTGPEEDQHHQQLVYNAANRACSQIVGRGMLTFSSAEVSHTSSYQIPPLVLQFKIAPSATILGPSFPPEVEDWPKFHNGVAGGLAIRSDAKEIDSSWIIFHKPETLSPEHGGFLLGLGLNGHLRSLSSWHAYPYLKIRHDFTSIGLLLGLAASYAGSQDPLLTKILSSGITSLLPKGSMTLNTSPLIQSASIMGIGLVFAGSAKHRMADAALQEIGRSILPGIEVHADHREAYSFSAACSFGLIMLGRGGGNPQYDDECLHTLRTCMNPTEVAIEDDDDSIDVNITAPGATLAVGFMFMRTNRKDISEQIRPPRDIFELDHIRPDLLMIRAISIGLIHWEDIQPSTEWLNKQIPDFILKAWNSRKELGGIDQTVELAYYNIVAGACFVVGLKYASTVNEDAYKLLTSCYAVYAQGLHARGPSSYEATIRKTAIRQGQNLIMTAYALVVVGTGDVSAYRKFRQLHGAEGGFSFGSRMAIHMAAGMLFLGAGRSTFGSSNFDIAMLCISFFPRFGMLVEDNRAYLQAYRHFWALAVQPTCVSTININTLQSVYLPLRADYKQQDGSMKAKAIIAPTLIYSFDSLCGLSINSPRYTASSIDAAKNSSDRALLIHSQVIYVKPKSGTMDYATDAKGNLTLSILSAPLLANGWQNNDGLLTGQRCVSETNREMMNGTFVNRYAYSSTLVSLKDRLGSGAMERAKAALTRAGFRFGTDADLAVAKALDSFLVEALLTDKKEEATIMVAILSNLGFDSVNAPSRLIQLQHIRDYYSSAASDYSDVSKVVFPFLRKSILNIAWNKVARRASKPSLLTFYFAADKFPENLATKEWQEIAIALAANSVPSLQHIQAMKETIANAKTIVGNTRDAPVDVSSAWIKILATIAAGNTGGSSAIWEDRSMLEAMRGLVVTRRS